LVAGSEPEYWLIMATLNQYPASMQCHFWLSIFFYQQNGLPCSWDFAVQAIFRHNEIKDVDIYVSPLILVFAACSENALLKKIQPITINQNYQ
jgi:hypothetical protein